MWESFSEKKGRLWGIWSSLALGDFQLCVYLTLLTSLTLQIYLGQAFTDISVCVYMRNVHPRERHAKRNWQDDRLSEAEWGDRAPHILLAPQASKSLNLFFFNSPAWRTLPCQNPIPNESPAANTGRECSKMGSKDPQQPYLWSKSPQRLVGRHPAVAGADLRAGKHFEYRRMMQVVGAWPWKQSVWAHLETVQEGVEVRVGHVLVELAWKTEGSGLWHALRDTAAN